MSEFDELKKPKRKNYVKKVEHKWSHDEIKQLIVAVQERRLLWDMGIPEYKKSKKYYWQEVANAIGSINVDDAKAKWMNLRISFKNNLAKYRLKMSRQIKDEPVVIQWRYFKSMMFLETSDTQQSTELASSLPMTFENTDASVKTEALCNFQTFKNTDASVKTGTSPCEAVEKLKRHRQANSGYSPTVSPTPATNLLRAGLQYIEGDKFSAFGDYIASELRALPPEQGTYVQRGLNRELLRLLEAVETPVINVARSILR